MARSVVERPTMNLNTLSKNYTSLTPEERFRLLLAAGARGDEAEHDRLTPDRPNVSISTCPTMPRIPRLSMNWPR